MAYKITYHENVKEDLEDLPKKEATRIVKKLEAVLSERPGSFPQLKGKYAGLRKFRVGNYRVIFEIMGNEVIVLMIGHRKDVYR
ncbi:MAG TPA: type II toxin-antitoxin system RelE/ParE family toxin [Thermodesulfobacteriota bacterium]|nr:type II toxin-antitoxin system RelE/ParE family toxin [Thermodesulfobacteriota bacterium]